MKTRPRIPSIFTLIILLSLITISGCNDDEVTRESSIQAKVNETLMVCFSVKLAPNPNPYNDPHNGIIGHGGGGNGEGGSSSYYIQLYFPISNGVGTYQIGDDNNEASIEMATPFGNASNNARYTAISGTIILSEVTENSYKGTFFFTAKASDWVPIMNVEEGVFEVIF